MKEILLCVSPKETRLAVTEDGRLFDFASEQEGAESLVGRIYKGTVKNVVPSVKGRFLDIGIGRNAFLRDGDCLASENRFPTEGSFVLVQIVKDATETKGPLVTMKISFPGRFSVLLTESDYIGVSRKIRDDAMRMHLRDAAKEILPDGVGMIFRTASGKVSLDAVSEEVHKLGSIWKTVQKRAAIQKHPGLMYRDGELSVRFLREFVTEDTDMIRVNDESTADKLSSLLLDVGKERPRVVYEAGDLFKIHGLEEDIEILYSREVPLPSGGSLVMESTEALTAIDVNSGGFHSPGIPHEEAAFLVNLKAAEEIARQIRMRGIGGMILIDFIDMETEAHKEAVVAALRRAVSKDRIKTAVLGMTQLGLVEMTRKRTSRTLWQKECEPCPYCGGSGRVLTVSAVILQIHRALSAERGKGGYPIRIECAPDVAAKLSEPEELFLLKTILLRPVRIEAQKSRRRDSWCLARGSDWE